MAKSRKYAKKKEKYLTPFSLLHAIKLLMAFTYFCQDIVGYRLYIALAASVAIFSAVNMSLLLLDVLIL